MPPYSSFFNSFFENCNFQVRSLFERLSNFEHLNLEDYGFETCLSFNKEKNNKLQAKKLLKNE